MTSVEELRGGSVILAGALSARVPRESWPGVERESQEHFNNGVCLAVLMKDQAPNLPLAALASLR